MGIAHILTVINNVNDIVGTIAAAVLEQSLATQDISGNIAQASTGIQEVNENVAPGGFKKWRCRPISALTRIFHRTGLHPASGPIIHLICLAIIFVLAMSWGTSPPSANANVKKRILVVHSYHQAHVSMHKRNDGLRAVLDKAPAVDLEFFYMDTKRKSSLAWKTAIGKAARKRIDAFKPDVVIAFDDNAQAFVTKKYLGAPKPQFVFAGVNGEPEEYGFPTSNVTGILERVYPDQSLFMLSIIDPTIKRVVCISDDSATSDGVIEYIKAGQMPLEIVAYEQPDTFAAWKQAVQKYQGDASVDAFLIPLYQTVKSTERGDRVPPQKVMRWTVTHITKPVAGLWPFATQDGALCAVTVDLNEHGTVAGNMALRILDGETAGQIPMVKNQDGFVILNIKAAERLDLHLPYEVIQSVDKLIHDGVDPIAP